MSVQDVDLLKYFNSEEEATVGLFPCVVNMQLCV